MAKAYLIGGTPRVGKTTLTLKFIKEKPMLGTSTDAIRYLLRRVVSEDKEPDLFHLGKYTSNDPDRRQYLKTNSQDVIEIQNKESVIVWRSVKDFIQSNILDGFDVLIEGIAVLPELVSKLDCEYSAVFLGNQSEIHFKTILDAARNNANDWMHNLEDETIEAFCVFNQHFSSFIENEAHKYGMSYVEMSDSNFEDSINETLRNLAS